MKNIYIPIEIKSREFYGKMLFACFAASAGCRVVIGEQHELRKLMWRLPPGVYIDKSVVGSKCDMFNEFRSLGHRVTAWCEEGLVFRHVGAYLRHRISSDSFNLLDRFFAWGPYQSNLIAGAIDNSEAKIVSAGNPRLDLLRAPFKQLYEREATELKERYGEFVLINTNFSRYNHFYSPEFQFERWKKRGKISTPEEEALFWEWSKYLGEMFNEFMSMLKVLSVELPYVKFIIRPHASEKHRVWHDAVKDLDNMEVIHEGHVCPWIIASKALIHNSCTTGVESFLLGNPTIAYMPVMSEKLDAKLPNELSLKAYSSEELVSVLRSVVEADDLKSSKDSYDRKHDMAMEYLADLGDAYSSEVIVNSILDVLVPDEEASDKPLELDRRRNYKAALMDLRRYYKRLKKFAKLTRRHSKQKFSGLSVEESISTLDEFKGVSGMFGDVKVRALKGAFNCITVDGL